MLQVSSPGPPPELTSLSTGDYLESWLSQVRGRVRGRTYSGYAGLLRRYAIPFLGEVSLKDLHPLHLQHLYGQLLEDGAGGYRDQLSASTVLNLHRVLVQSLGWAERFGLLERSPAKAARPPDRAGPSPRWWTPPWPSGSSKLPPGPAWSSPWPSPWGPACAEARSSDCGGGTSPQTSVWPTSGGASRPPVRHWCSRSPRRSGPGAPWPSRRTFTPTWSASEPTRPGGRKTWGMAGSAPPW